jgi:peptidyl-dipeptidase Dcp
MVLATTGCADKGGKEVHAATPFFSVSSLPFHAPRFDKIRNADFKPAIDSGIAQQQHDIRQIASNPETPTFANTFIPLEKSGQLLARVMGVFNLLTSANTNPVLQQVQQEEAPKLAANQDAIYLNSRLFGRVRQIYEARDTLKLDSESLRLVEYYYRKFEMAGAGLPDSAKTRLKKLNEEEATLSTRFTNKLLAATKEGALVASDTSTLAGLSPGQMKAASEAAAARGLKGKWLIPLQNTTQQPALQSLTDRATRKKLFEASWTRAELGDSDDTRGTIQRLAEVRAGKAKLLGFPDYAAWKLQDQMAKTPQRVQQFLARLIPAATAKAHEEAAAIQAVIDRDKGGFTLQPWDWNFYAEQLRRTKYDLDQDEVRSYFVLDTVLREGVFYAANRLYGLTFKERHDVPVYQPDVKVFEVYDKDGKALGLFYCDYFKRDNKSGGAWMDNIVVQSRLLGTAPVIYNVANFTKPAPGQPALISFDDVTTMFHEFGHALHGFFASQEYPSLSGTNVARDFVEFPSQFNEHWALDTSVLKHYAKNYRTGQPIPEALVERIKKAATFNQGYMLTELLAAAELDMQWHLLPGGVTVDNVDSFETAALDKTHLNLRQVPPRYRSSYFMHIWGNGYAAAYYAYLWTEMLDDNVYAWFEQHGGLTRAGGQRLRDMILSRGNTEDYDKMFRDFCGHDPEIGPMLKDRGLPPR